MNNPPSWTVASNHRPWRIAGLLFLLILLLPVAAAAVDPPAPQANALELTFTGNDQIVVKTTIDAPGDGYRRWGEIYRNEGLIATAMVGAHHYLDLGLPLGQSFVYKLLVYTQNEDTGAITTLGPYTTPATTTGQVRGDVPIDMTWEGGVWNLTGWVTVPEGVILTIEPGTTVIGAGDLTTSFHVQDGGDLEVSGATLEALWVEHDDLYGHYGNVSITDSVLNSVVVFANGLDFRGNRGQNCTIWNYYNTFKRKARYAENVFTGSQFNISFRWAEPAGDFYRRPAITIENNDFDFLGIETGYPESTLNRAWVKIQNNEVAQGIYVTGKDHERRFVGDLYIENNYTRRIDVEFAHFPWIEDNTVVGDGGPNYGIFLGSDVEDALVQRNTLRQAHITLKQSSSPPPSHGLFEKNIAPGGWLNLWYGENNIFIDNAFKGVVAPPGSRANTWNKLSPASGPNVVGGPQKGGNWYSDYTGVDANGDGFGDTPHVIATGNVDQYPLVMANPGPDLAVDAFHFSQQDITLSFDRRYVLPVDVTVANDGWLPASNVPVAFFGNGALIETQTIPNLAVGGSPAALHLNWDITPLLIQGQGLADLTLEVVADPDDALGDPIRSNNQRSYSLHVDGRPQPKFQTSIPLEGTFVHGTSVPNLFAADIDWTGAFSGATSAPFGDAWFDLNGALTSVPGQEWGAAKTYNMGADFLSSFGCGNNTLQVWASHPVAGGNLTSPKTVFQPTVLPYPEWVEWAQANIPGSDAALTAAANPFYAEYGYGFPWPNPALEALWTPPADVPYLGGTPLGLAPSQAAVRVAGRSTGAGSVVVTGTIGYDLAGLTAPGALSGAGQATLSCADGLALSRAGLNLRVTAPVTAERTLTQVVPGVAAAGDEPVHGRYLDWLVHTTQVPATFTPYVDVQTVFRVQDGQLAFVPSVGTAPVTTSVSLAVQPAPGLALSVYGGGQAAVDVQVPPDPDYLQQGTIALYFEARLQNGPFENVYGYGVDCLYPGDCQTVETTGRSNLVSRDYAQRPASAALAAANHPAAETVLVSNVYPYAEPALAIRADGQRLLAYVHDDVAKPQGRGGEIRALRYAGGWTGPVSVTDDQQPDYAPALAYDGDGDGLLVWERSTLAAGITPTLDITYAQSLEIAYATYSGAWSAPALLTSNNLMDRAPRLARGAADGAVLALWETSDGYDSLGSAAHPLTLTYALWAGGAWSAPAPAVGGLQDVVGVAMAAYSATRAALVYAVDGDGALTTTADTDLYYSTFDGAAWSAPALIADGASLADSSPALAYDSNGGRHLLWLRDGDLVWLKDSWDLADVEVVRAGSAAGGWLGFVLAPDDAGNVALVWQTVDENGTNLAALVYDSSANLWSADRPLTVDAAAGADVEAYPAPALAGGALYTAYARTQTELAARSFEVAPGEWITVTVPQPGASDLVFLDHALGRDLTFGSLAITPANPAPGQAATVTAVLHNAGDLAVDAPQVALYDGPTAIATVSLPGALGGGRSVPVTVPWTAPLTPAASHLLRAVADPNALVSETDEANNQISLTTTLPDLDVALFHTGHQTGTLILTTVLANAGVVDVAQPFTLAFRVGDPVTGILAAQATVNASVPAGGAITLTHTLTDLAHLAGLGNTLWAIADAEAAILEANEENNQGYAPFGLLPDLALTTEDIQGAGPVTVRVHNVGLSAAADVSLAVRRDGPGGPLVYSGIVGDLAAGDSRTVQFMPPVGEIELWAQVDPDNLIAEGNEGNNLAARALHIAYWVYLPLVAR